LKKCEVCHGRGYILVSSGSDFSQKLIACAVVIFILVPLFFFLIKFFGSGSIAIVLTVVFIGWIGLETGLLTYLVQRFLFARQKQICPKCKKPF